MVMTHGNPLWFTYARFCRRRRNTIGAIYGTYASFDQGRPKLMSISADTARNVMFYRKYFGIKTDPEGRNYGVFTHGMKMLSSSRSTKT
jgi:hypothetical protein